MAWRDYVFHQPENTGTVFFLGIVVFLNAKALQNQLQDDEVQFLHLCGHGNEFSTGDR